MMKFLSTPSARRATKYATAIRYGGRISIHALREEGDRASSSRRCHSMYFYPRPPRGGRRDHPQLPPYYSQISIHALREEGDLTRSPVFMN